MEELLKKQEARRALLDVELLALEISDTIQEAGLRELFKDYISAERKYVEIMGNKHGSQKKFAKLLLDYIVET